MKEKDGPGEGSIWGFGLLKELGLLERTRGPIGMLLLGDGILDSPKSCHVVGRCWFGCLRRNSRRCYRLSNLHFQGYGCTCFWRISPRRIRRFHFGHGSRPFKFWPSVFSLSSLSSLSCYCSVRFLFRPAILPVAPAGPPVSPRILGIRRDLVKSISLHRSHHNIRIGSSHIQVIPHFAITSGSWAMVNVSLWTKTSNLIIVNSTGDTLSGFLTTLLSFWSWTSSAKIR